MLTNKDFTKKLNKELKGALSLRDTFQELIISGIEQYDREGDTYQLTLLITSSVEVKSLPTVTLKDFIKEHTDLKFDKNKAGEYQFVRADKQADKKAILPTINWYEWKKAKHNNVREVDYVKRLANDVKNARSKGVQTSQMLEAMLAGGLSASELMKALDNLNNLKLKAIAA